MTTKSYQQFSAMGSDPMESHGIPDVKIMRNDQNLLALSTYTRGPDPLKLLSSKEGRHIHFAVMAIESGARKMGITGQEMHDRLKAQNLIHDRLLAFYEQLHTQSREWVAEDIVETLENWEAAK